MQTSKELNHEALVVGWISSTDVMLLCVIFMVALAFAGYKQLESERETTSDNRQEATNNIGRLKKELDDLKKQMGNDATKLARRVSELEEEKKISSATVAELRAEIEQLNKKLENEFANNQQINSQLRSEKAELWRKYEAATTTIEELQGAIEALKTASKEFKAQTEAASEAKKERIKVLSEQVKAAKINPELLGLQGKCERVAFICDASGSMLMGNHKDDAQSPQARDRWEGVFRTLSRWIGHLAVQEAVLIVYNDGARAFKKNGREVVSLKEGVEGDQSRKDMIAFLRETKPDFGTNTRAALELAYSYSPDSIILFTDGAPNNGKGSTIDPDEVKRIHELCTQHPLIPINVIGVGDYYEAKLAEFFNQLKKDTNGSFIGQ
jgi:parvulin-like peptidyl-prolyl isomerase